MSPRNRILPTHKYTCTHTYTHTRTHIHSQIHLETCTLTKTLAHKLTYTQIVITDTGTCSEDSCKNKDTHIYVGYIHPQGTMYTCSKTKKTNNSKYMYMLPGDAMVCECAGIFRLAAPHSYWRTFEATVFILPFPLSRPCLCQNTKEILIFAFILTHITFFPGVCHKHKHYFQRQDKTIVSAIELSQVSYKTCSCKIKMQNWQTMCFSVSMVGIFIYFRF